MAKRSTSALYEDFNKFVESQKKNTKTVDSKLIDDFKKFRQNTSSTREAQQYVQQQQKAEDRLLKSREQAVQASRNRLNNLRNDAGFKAQADEASRAYDKLYGQDKYTSAGDYQYYRTKYGHALENVDRYIRDINYLTSVGEMDRDERLDYLKEIPNYSTTKYGTRLLDSAKAFNDYYSQYKSEKDYKDQLAKEAEVNRIRGLDATRTKEAYDVTTKQINAMKERASQYDLQDPRYETTWQRIRKMEEENIRRRDDLNAWSKYQLAEEQQRKAEEEQERIKNLDLSYLETMRKRKYEQMATYDKSIVQWGVTGDQDKIDELIAVSNSVQKEIDELDRDIALKKRYNKGLQYKALTDSIGQEDNYNEEYARQNAVYNAVNSSRSIDLGFGSNIKNLQEASYPMTDAERKTYNRIVAESGFDAGKEYLDYLEPTFEARIAQSISEGLEEYSSKDPFGGIVANIYAGYIKPGGAIYTLGHNLQNAFKNAHNYRAALNGDTGSMVDRTELDINSPWFTGSIMGEATTAGITKNMSPTAAFLTQTGLSIAQNLSQMGFGEPLTLALMGMGSMSDTAREIKQNGGTDDKALLGGVLAGIAEVLFEKVSLDQVISMAETGRMSDLLQNLGKQGFIEGSEETFTEVANIISDIMVNGGASDAAQLKEMYLRQGYTDEEAQKMVFRDLAKQIGLAGLGGALSGSVMGAGATGYGAVRNDIRNFWNTRRIGKAIIDNDGTYQNIPTVQELMQRASEISPDVANAFTEKDLQNKQKVGQLFRDVVRAEAANPTFTSEDFTNKYAKKSDKNVSRGRTGSLAERFSMTKDFSAKVNGSNTSVYFDHISDDDIVYVRTSDNRVVKADSIETDPKTKQLFENAADYGKEGAKAFINNYDGEMNVTEYAKAFQITAEQAKSYETEDNAVRIGMENGLTETAARSAYYVGKNLQDLYDSGNIASIRNYANTIDTATMKQAIIDKFKGKTVYVDKVDTTNVVEQYKSIFDDQHVKVSQNVDFASVDATKQESLASVVALIRAIGRDVNILSVKDMTENRNGKQSTANAYFKGEDNTYYLCVEQMDQAYMNVAIHETVHDIAKNAPEEYKKLKDIILKYVKDSNTFNADLMHEFNLLYGEDAKWETATQAQKDAAYEELIANTTTAILKDPSTLQSFADRFIKDDETREVFVSFLDKLIDTFRKAFNKIKQRFGWRQIQQIENNLTALEEIRDAYFEGLEGVRDAQPVNTARLTIDNIENQTEAERENLAELSRNGVEIDETGAANARYSWRTFDSSEKAREDMVNRLVEAGFDRAYSEQWLEDINSVYALVMNDLKALDYKADSRYSWLKKNSDYTQGSVDFNNNCPKRVEFTALCDRLFKEFPNTVLTADDFEALRQVLIKNKITVTCGICFVEDRRQGLSTVVQTYIDQLKDGSLAPMFKNLLKGDTYIPTQYDLITYDGYYDLYKNHRGVYESFRRYNNHRGMASIRLLEGMGEYNNEIRKWTKRTVTSKNNKGGLRIFSTSDADPRILLDIMQIVNDAAAKGLQIQGYTKKPWFAKLVRNTGIRLLQSHIPSGIGYETVDGRKVLTFDNREGINTRDPDYLDTSDSLYIGNNVIGINDEQIRIAMTDPMIDQIIPFHSNQSKAILEAKGISHYKNYKTFQTDKKLSDGTVGHQINLYTEVIREFERRGQPIKNKYDFVNAFLQVCKEKNLKPRFSEFLNTDANGDYVYTEGYHKFLVDYKMFDKNGNYIPQVSVTPAFDMEVANATIKKYVKMDEYINKAVAPEVKEKAYQEMKEVVQNKLKFSVNTDSLGNQLTEEQDNYFADSKIRDNNGNLKVMYHGTNADFNIFDQLNFGEVGDTAEGFGIYLTDTREVADSYGGRIIEAYANVTRPASKNAKTIKRAELARLIKATCENEAKSLMEDGYDSIEDALKDTWVSNYTYTYDKPMNAVYNQVAADILRMNDNDMDIVQEVMAGMAIRDYTKAYEFYPLLTETMGIDGFETMWEDSRDPENPAHIVVAFNSEQVKNIDNKTPTSNPDIRYSPNQDRVDRDILSNKEWALFYNAIGDLKQGVRAETLNGNGDLLISFGDKAENIIAVCSGTYEDPGIIRLYKINLENEKDVEDYRNDIKRLEETFGTDEIETVESLIRQGIIGSYYSNSARSFDEIWQSEGSRSNGETGGENAETDRTSGDGGRDSGSNQDILKNYSIDLSSLNNSDDKNLDNFKNTVGTQYKLNIAKKLTPEVADKMAGRILREYHSSYAREELSQKLTALINDAARQGRDLDVDTFINQGAALLSDVLEKSTEFNQEAYDADDKVRSYLNGIKIKLTSTQEQGVTSAFESVRAYRAGLFGSAVKINQSTGISLDVIWGELSALNPVLFPADANEGDMPMYLADAAQMLKKANYYFNPYGFDAEGMGAIIFADMVADYADDTRIKTVVNQMKAYGRHYFSDTMKDLNRRTRERAAQQKAQTEKLKADLARVKEETRKYLNDMDELILDINNKITQAEYEMRALPAGSDRFDYEQTIAGLKKTRERYEYSVREWKRQQTEEAQRLQKEIEESAKNYLKAGGKGINYAMDARQAVIRTRSLVQQKQLKEQAQRRTVINTVRRNANNLLGRLLNSSDTRHVPENLRIPVATFLQNLDLGFTGEESNAAVTWIENIGKLADKMRNFNEANGTFQVDDMIIEQLNDIASDLRIRLETAGKRLSDMSLYELQQLRDTVSLINAAIYNSDRLLADGRKQRASSLAERSINEMAGKKQRKHTKGILKMAGDFFGIDQLDSFSYAERLGSDFNNVIFKNLRKGFDTKVKYVQQGNEAFAEALKKLAPDEKTAKRLLKTMSGDNAVSTAYMLESGNTLTLTPAQVMELYLLNNREDARRHIYNGGITVMEYGKGKNTVKKQEMVQVTEGDVKNIIDTLSPQQKAFADAMQKFAATSISEWGNNVSMTLWGIKKFTDPNYWKIRSDSNTLNAIATEKNSPDNVGLYHLKNLGSSKATNPLATNPLIVGDAIDSFVSHVDEMSSYGAYTVPLDDAMKWYNYKNGNRTTQRAIENYMGIAGKEYFTDFIKTLNSSQPNAGGMPILDKLISNAKVAAIAANLRVVIQQPSAYARAMDVIDPKYLVQTGNPKAGAEEAQKYCSIAAWKNWGFRDADIGRSLRDVMVGDTGSLAQRINEVTGKPAGWADDITWGAIWNAVKAEVKDKNPQLRIGTQEFYDAVSERFTEVIDKTQVVDSPFHRSKGMRSKNMLWKMATAFMSEPTKSYNMFYRTVSDAYQNGVNARTAKRFTRALVSFVTATALNSMLASIIDAIRHRDDDDDKDFWDRYLSEAGQNLLDGLNPLNLIPIGKDIMSMIDGYSPSRLDLDAMNSLIQTGKKALQLINGEGKNLNGWRIAYDLIGDASKVTGIPAGNMLRTVDSIAKMFGANWFGKYNEWASSKQTAGSMYTEYKKTGKWTEDLLEKYVSMRTDEVIKEEEQRELEGHNRKYATTEDVTRYATNQVYGNFASMLAEDDERIAEAYEAKVSGNSATVTRIKKVFTDAGIPGEIFDKAVLVYGNSHEESDPKSIRDFNAQLYDYDDLAQAIINGHDADDIYNEIISDSTAQDPEKNTVSHTMERLEEYYKKYMLDGNTRKAEQIIDNAQKTFELDDSRFESWSKSVDYIQFSEQNPNVSMTQDDYQRYQKVASSGITPETWMQYYEQANTMKADVDSNGEAIKGSKKKKVLVLIDSLPITDAQKDALYYYNNWAESTIKEAPWH